jgi:hypothetical protein
VYAFAFGTVDLNQLREGLVKMNDAELLRFGKAAKFMCSPQANLTQSISMLPLLLLLFPEGAAIPRNWPPTAAHLLFSNGLLAVGSFGFGFLIAGLGKARLLLRNKAR